MNQKRYTQLDEQTIANIKKLMKSKNYAEVEIILDNIEEELLGIYFIASFVFNIYEIMQKDEKMLKIINAFEKYNKRNFEYYHLLTKYNLHLHKYYQAYKSSKLIFENSDKKPIHFLPMVETIAKFSSAPDFTNFNENINNEFYDNVIEKYERKFAIKQDFVFENPFSWSDNLKWKAVFKNKNNWELLVEYNFNIYDSLLLMHIKLGIENSYKNFKVHLIPRKNYLPDYASIDANKLIEGLKFDLKLNKTTKKYDLEAFVIDNTMETLNYANSLKTFFKLLAPFGKYQVSFNDYPTEDLYNFENVVEFLSENSKQYTWPKKYDYLKKLRFSYIAMEDNYFLFELQNWLKKDNYEYMGYLHEQGIYFLDLEITTEDIHATIKNYLLNFYENNLDHMIIFNFSAQYKKITLTLMILNSSSSFIENIYKEISIDNNVSSIVLQPLQNQTDKKFTLYSKTKINNENNVKKYNYNFFYNKNLANILIKKLKEKK
ncbi:hypothetical protein N8G13_01895 [Mycoplasma zalophi]|uniref:hypothetical protein n=1 Tax=Mycoplasma zalophi TaxID=191287 RepID=UPI0021C99FE5|nr:hypothetical protein [Mycoplasma zalophi]MCU4117208.1 hypothetical protein [Mycoplasma zalophi]